MSEQPPAERLIRAVQDHGTGSGLSTPELWAAVLRAGSPRTLAVVANETVPPIATILETVGTQLRDLLWIDADPARVVACLEEARRLAGSQEHRDLRLDIHLATLGAPRAGVPQIAQVPRIVERLCALEFDLVIAPAPPLGDEAVVALTQVSSWLARSGLLWVPPAARRASPETVDAFALGARLARENGSRIAAWRPGESLAGLLVGAPALVRGHANPSELRARLFADLPQLEALLRDHREAEAVATVRSWLSQGLLRTQDRRLALPLESLPPPLGVLDVVDACRAGVGAVTPLGAAVTLTMLCRALGLGSTVLPLATDAGPQALCLVQTTDAGCLLEDAWRNGRVGRSDGSTIDLRDLVGGRHSAELVIATTASIEHAWAEPAIDLGLEFLGDADRESESPRRIVTADLDPPYRLTSPIRVAGPVALSGDARLDRILTELAAPRTPAPPTTRPPGARLRRILFLHSAHPMNPRAIHSGAENALIALARTLAAHGAEVTVLANLTHDDTVDGVRWLCAGSPGTWEPGAALARADGRFDATVSTMSASALRGLDPRLGVRLLWPPTTIFEVFGMPPATLGDAVDAVCCISVAQEELFVAAGMPRSLIRRLTYGVDTAVFCPAASPDTTSAAQRRASRVVFAGALIAEKGIDYLLAAWPHVVANVPDAELVICGSGSLWGRDDAVDPSEMTARVPRVRFAGALGRDELACELRGAALCVVPTPPDRYREGSPLVALEALACGTPIVVSASGGLPDIVREMSALATARDGPGPGVGWVVDPLTPGTLAAQLILALRDPTTLEQAGRRASLAASEHSWDASARALMAIVDEFSEGASAPREITRPTDAGGLGFVSTWEQPCGLARFAAHLVAALPAPPRWLFAEAADPAPPAWGAEDASPVRRVWTRGRPLDGLAGELLKARPSVVHVNHHGSLFGATLSPLLARLSEAGIPTTVTLHAPNRLDPETTAIGRLADRVVVLSDGARLEVLANGVAAEKVVVIPMGLRPLEPRSRDACRTALGLDAQATWLVQPGMIQPHKGLPSTLTALAELRRDRDVRLIVAGRPPTGDSAAATHLEACRVLGERLGIADAWTAVDTWLTDDDLATLLGAADVIVLPYESGWWEASAAARDALASGRPVVTSPALAFHDLGDAVFRANAGIPLADSLRAVLDQPALRAALRARTEQLVARDSWAHVAACYATLWHDVETAAQGRRRNACTHTARPRRASLVAATTASPSRSESRPPAPAPLRVLQFLRRDAHATGGGDVRLLSSWARCAAEATPQIEVLQREACDEQADVILADLAGDDTPIGVVHLVNLATARTTEAQARACLARGLPYLLTALHEDWPAFKVASEVALQAARRRLGLPPTVDLGEYVAMHAREIAELRSVGGFIVENAALVLASGASEVRRIERDFPTAAVVAVPSPVDAPPPGDPAAFRRRYEVRGEFVLCIGRLEPRKNQLALLEAMADDPRDLVLATGGIAYRRDYVEACRAMRRRGRTLFLPALSIEELGGALRAADLHVVASWFELPGLVTLEALLAGTAVVATDAGSLRDALDDTIPWAAPDDLDSLRRAIAAAPAWDYAAARARARLWSTQRVAPMLQQVLREVAAATSADRSTKVRPSPDRSAPTWTGSTL